MSTRILCVEDNPQNMRLVRKILKHRGYDVLEAEDGLTGVQLAMDQQPDLILMDINLPDIDGLEATKRIKDNADTASIPVVALTANAMYGDEERALAAGCDGYISKPVSKTKLLSMVDDFLAQQAQDSTADVDTATDDDNTIDHASADTDNAPSANGTPPGETPPTDDSNATDDAAASSSASKQSSKSASPKNTPSSSSGNRGIPAFRTGNSSTQDNQPDETNQPKPEAQRSASDD